MDNTTPANLGVFPHIDGVPMTQDLLAWDYRSLKEIPDIIWASPVCQSFSIMAHQHRGPKCAPLTEAAVLGDKLLSKTIEIINYFSDLNENLVWYFENPRAKMRHSPLLDEIDGGYHVETVSYCMYATDRLWPKKPTDIFTNDADLVLKMCSKSTPCDDLQRTGKTTHTAQVRGHGGAGEQVVDGLLERYRIPPLLIADIFNVTLPGDFIERTADIPTTPDAIQAEPEPQTVSQTLNQNQMLR